MTTILSRPRSPYAALAVVGLGAALPTMDIAVNVAFPAITAAFALEGPAIRWVVVFYVVTYACLMLACGRLGDAIGHRRIFRAGVFVGIAGYLGCALAPDYGWLLAARVVQGVSTALLLSCAPALATQAFSEARRTHALGMLSAITAFAAAAAPILGGACIAWLGWAGAFWVRVPLLLVLLATLDFLPERGPVGPATDRGNLALLAFAIACLLLAPSMLGSGGNVPASIAFLAAGCVGLAAFVVQQRRADSPFFPRAVAADPDFVLHNAASVVLQFGAFSVPLLVPYYLARIAGFDADGIGGTLAFSPLGMLIGAAAAPAAVRRFGTRAGALAAAGCLAAGTLGIASWGDAPMLIALAGALAIHGVGLGMFQVVYTDVVVGSLPRDARGVAGSLTMVTRTVGVVTAATALTAAAAALEEVHALTGADTRTAYVRAFSQLFVWLALLPAGVVLIGMLRRRLFRRPDVDEANAPPGD